MGYTTVIFDYDGTLVDSQEGIAKGFQQALAAYGIREEVEEIKKLIGPPLSRTIVTKYGFGEEDAKEAMAIFRRYVREHGNEECRVFDGVPEMLRGLREAGCPWPSPPTSRRASPSPRSVTWAWSRTFPPLWPTTTPRTGGPKATLSGWPWKPAAGRLPNP